MYKVFVFSGWSHRAPVSSHHNSLHEDACSHVLEYRSQSINIHSDRMVCRSWQFSLHNNRQPKPVRQNGDVLIHTFPCWYRSGRNPKSFQERLTEVIPCHENPLIMSANQSPATRWQRRSLICCRSCSCSRQAKTW
jgi:hypothetical protein